MVFQKGVIVNRAWIKNSIKIDRQTDISRRGEFVFNFFDGEGKKMFFFCCCFVEGRILTAQPR